MTQPLTLGEKVGRAAAWNVLALGALALLSFATSILLARRLPQAEFAAYGLFVASAASLLAMVDLGLSTSIPKFAALATAEGGARGFLRMLRLVAGIKLLLLGVGAAILLSSGAAVRHFVGLSAQAPASFLSAVLIVATLDAMSDVMQQGLSTCLAQGAIQTIRIAESIVLSGMTIALVMAGLGVAGVLYAFLSSSALKALLSAAFLAREARRLPSSAGPPLPFASVLPRLARHSAAIYATKMCAYLAGPAYATVVLGGSGGPAIVARFTLAADLVNRVYELVSAPVNSILVSLFANLALRDDPEPARRAYGSILRFYGFALIPTGVGLAVLAPDLLPVMYGQGYAASVPYFRWLLAGVLLDYVLYAAASSMLLTAERYRVVLLSRVPIVAAAAAMGAVARTYGPIAAVAAICVARVAGSWVLAGLARASMGARVPVGFLGRLAAIAALLAWPMWVAVEGLPSSKMECAGMIVGYAIAFWALFKATGGIGREERERIAGMRIPLKAWILRII